ncbi:MAG: FAD-dependent oxidoreductase [Myxococcota bacterium]|nr:FAD-dependent oxidoreductase [Myxococcota bacterium]
MTLPREIETLVLGAGLAGLSAAHHIPSESIILESNPWVGGKARSEQIDGFTFDVTGHWLHLRDPSIRRWILDLLGDDHFLRVRRLSRIWSHGVYTRYPFQANTFGLPPSVVKACVLGAVEAWHARGGCPLDPDDEPENFADWIRAYFGEGIARHFMIPYNAKLWGVDAHEITSHWCQRFVPRPNLEDIVAGAVGCHDKEMGYNAEFLYPKHGGIQTVAEAIADAVGRARIFLQQTVTSIDHQRRIVTLQSGAQIRYRKLVNTMALPSLVDCFDECPDKVRQARGNLRATEVIYFNVGIRGPLGVPDHWVYVPELEWPMYRVGSFTNANPAMAPNGHSSLYVELSDRETDPAALVPRVTEGLVAMGFIDEPSQVLFMTPRRIENAYVIYDRHYAAARAQIHDWLAGVGITSIGRYGDWNYSSMEDALLAGRAIAKEDA